MDNNANDQNELYELYERFRSDVQKHNRADIFYDESDLVEIYDYANDNNDEFVKSEVLLCGAHLYPDSDWLAVRQAYRCFENGDVESAKMLLDRSGDKSILADILRLKISCASQEKVKEQILKLTKTPHKEDDETIIQLVNLIEENDLTQWANQRVKKFSEICEFPATLYYEMGTLNDSEGNFDDSAKLLEEATMIEPFNASFWESLAQTYYNGGSLDKALNAADYALAIDDRSQRALLIRAQVLVDRGQQLDQVAESMQKMVEEGDNDQAAAQLLLMCYEKEAHHDKADNLALMMNKKYPYEKAWVDFLLSVSDKPFDRSIIDRYFSLQFDGEAKWMEWAVEYMSHGMLTQAAELLLCLKRFNRLQKGYSLLYETLYRLGKYDIIIRDTITTPRNASKATPEWRPEMALIAVLSFVRSGMESEGLQMAKSIVSRLSTPDMMPFFDQIAWFGVLRCLRDLIAAAESDDPIPIDQIDPFRFNDN